MINISIKDDTYAEFDKAVKLFKKKVNNEGFLREVRERRYYSKPSEIRHKKDGEIKRERARLRKNKRRY